MCSKKMRRRTKRSRPSIETRRSKRPMKTNKKRRTSTMKRMWWMNRTKISTPRTKIKCTRPPLTTIMTPTSPMAGL